MIDSSLAFHVFHQSIAKMISENFIIKILHFDPFFDLITKFKFTYHILF